MALPGAPCRGAGPRTVLAPAGFLSTEPSSVGPELTPGHMTPSQVGDTPPPGGIPGVLPALGTAAAPCSLLIVFQTEILRLDSLLKRIDQCFECLTALSEARTFV